jgi:hypothetical protein
MNQSDVAVLIPGEEEVVKDSTSCSRWKEGEKEW